MTYLQWNDALAQTVFSRGRVGGPVSLCLSQEEIENAGGSTFADFVAAVEIGVPWGKENKKELSDRPLDAVRGWRRVRQERGEPDWPPYLAYLILFVYAAALDGDFSANDYYRRLRGCVTQVQVRGTFKDDVIAWLCEDLEKWSNIDKKGELGSFRYFVYGAHRYVGPLLAQTVISQRDRTVLPWVFEQSGFDPASPPRERELLGALKLHGASHLRPRTGRILEQISATILPAQQMLADIVMAELIEWDGRVEKRFDQETQLGNRDREKSGRDGAGNVSGSLRLCGQYKMGTGQFRAHLRCKTPIEFPDDGFWLLSQGQKSGEALVAEAWDGSWSRPIASRADAETTNAKALDAAELDWGAGWTLRDAERGWKFRWRKAEVRLLSRDPEGVLDDLIEVFRLPLGREVWVLAAPTHSQAVDGWGQKHGREWNLSATLASGWTLFACKAIGEGARAVKNVPHPVLEASSSASLLWRGGVRVNKAARFFDFAMPRVEIDGPDDAILCWRELGGTAWKTIEREADGLFSLPGAIAEKQAVRLSARRGWNEANGEEGEEIAAQTLYIERDQWDWRNPVADESPIEKPIAPPLELGGMVGIEEDGALIYLGRQPGQIARYPAKPAGWPAVWIVNGGRKRRAVYCGSDLGCSEPVTGTNKGQKPELKAWKEQLNAQVAIPQDRELAALWKSYLQVAKTLKI